MFYEEEQACLFDPDTWSGKTSPEPSAATKAKTSRQSSKKRSGSQSRKPPLFLCLTKDGPQADATMTWTDGGALLGEFSTHSFGECPSAAVESHLSQILEAWPHPKYYLSAKACQGILNRANRRGKKLPPLLEQALVAQSQLPSKSEEDALGGKGALIQTDKSATLSTLQDQTLFQPILLESNQKHATIRTDGISTTLPAAMGMGGGYIPMVCGFSYKAGAKAGGIGIEEEKAPTLSSERHDASVCYPIENHPQDSRVKLSEGNVVQTLSGKMGTGGVMCR